MRIALVTGSSGLVGSEAVMYFDARGWTTHGVDNNMRREFFGPDGDTTPNLGRLRTRAKRFVHHTLDIRDRSSVFRLVRDSRPDLVIHCAAQPSHDLSRQRPIDDFEINALATLNLLEAARLYCPESPFIFLSTNKVYGDTPNRKRLVELDTRWDYCLEEDHFGIDENCSIDQSLHSPFGSSKLAADIMVQEYGRYFGMPTTCLRAGCITGPNHAGAELHGFLSYLVRCFIEHRSYTIFGYKGKQVRDNIHSFDLCTLFEMIHSTPRPGSVYNVGGGRMNSISVLEAISRLETFTGRSIVVSYSHENRVGDHVCYISDLRKLERDYPSWRVTRGLDEIFRDLFRTEGLAPMS